MPPADAELITADEAAARLGQKPQTLRNWRSMRKGPKYLKLGRLVYYRPADLTAWLATRVIDPEAGRAA